MLWTKVVLPTPGPPVMITALLASANRTVPFWEAKRLKPVRSSTQGDRLGLLAGMQK